MLGFDRITLEYLTSTPFLVGLVFLALITLAGFIYYRTNPPISPIARSVLGALRVIALVALFLSLFETVIGFSRQYERSPRVSVIVDRSGSMDKDEDGRTRLHRADSLMASSDFARLNSAADVTTYYFGGELSQNAVNLMRDQTALGNALHDLAARELAEPADYWLLFSDGRSNSGREPEEAARNLESPVYTVDLAVNAGKLDVGLTDLEFNPIMFVGQKAQVKVKLGWQNAVGKSIRVELIDSSRTADTKRFSIDLEGGMGDVTLDYMPTEPGQRILEVNIPPLDGEESTDNNHRSFAVKVLKSRLNVLIVTSHPDYDVGFIKRFLDQSDKYDVELRVTGSKSGNLGGRFPQSQAELNRFDLTILHDPNPREYQQHANTIRSYLSDRGGSLWVIMGQTYAGAGPSAWLNELLPFYQRGIIPVRYGEFQGEPTEGNLYHPAIRLAETQSAIRTAWAELPPFRALVPCDSSHPGAVVLAHSSTSGRLGGRWPILGYKVVGPGKVFATAAVPIWSWGFTNLGYGGDNQSFLRFMDGVSSWLTVKEDFDPITIKPEKEVFSRGEVVRFEGLAYDQGFRPIPGVLGQVRLSGQENDAIEMDLIEIGEGKYRAEIQNLPAGTYRYSGRFEKDGRLLKQVDGVIKVETFSLEEFDRSGDPGTMTAVASLSGGRYHKFDEFTQVVNEMALDPIAEASVGEVVVWNKPWLLLVIIGALSIEWVSRKFLQLI